MFLLFDNEITHLKNWAKRCCEITVKTPAETCSHGISHNGHYNLFLVVQQSMNRWTKQWKRWNLLLHWRIIHNGFLSYWSKAVRINTSGRQLNGHHWRFMMESLFIVTVKGVSVLFPCCCCCHTWKFRKMNDIIVIAIVLKLQACRCHRQSFTLLLSTDITDCLLYVPNILIKSSQMQHKIWI